MATIGTGGGMRGAFRTRSAVEGGVKAFDRVRIEQKAMIAKETYAE